MPTRPTTVLLASVAGTLLAIGVAVLWLERRSVRSIAGQWWARGCA